MMKKQTGRLKLLQNNNWKFMHGDYLEAREYQYNDRSWYDIGIPHSFGIPYFQENEFYVGYGCYRKMLHIDEVWIGKKISLEFQGAFQETEIYLNGQLAGVHRGGYTAFEIDITSYAVPGSNLLFVRLNNNWNPRLAPRAGEHVFNGGIYRDVSLLVTEPVHIGWYGTCVTTPEVSKEEAVVAVTTEVKNEGASVVKCTLVSIVEFQGKELFQTSVTRILNSGGIFIFNQGERIGNPELWHPDAPNLYMLRSFVYVGEELYDTYETTFGIRWFRFTADKGFFLNGERYDVNGANVHQDHAGWSDAVTHSGIQRDVKMVKDCGMNFIRGSHYPHHTVFADECDKQGVLFWSENCFWGTGGPKVEGYWTSSGYPVNEEDQYEFEESCIRTLQEMIRTNRNHPSIIVWSMCNEPFFSTAEVMDKARALVKRLVKASHEADPTRPAAVGGAQRGGFDTLGDIAGYNGDGATIFHDPGFPNFVSEYGSYEESNRPGSSIPNDTKMDYPWRSGKALWCAFHHGSILWDMGYLGMIDYYRLPLNIWYWYRENLLGMKPPKPVEEGIPYGVRITADRTTIATDGTEDTHVMAGITDKDGNRIANTMEIVLEVVSGGAIFPTGRTFVLSLEKHNFYEGFGAIELRSYYAGENRIIAKADGLVTRELIINAVGEEIWNNQVLNELMPPPSVMALPKSDKEFNIGISRPVFASSAHPDYAARNVTDTNSNTPWHAASKIPGEWLMIDLEGAKPVSRCGIFFEEVSSNPYEISISSDGIDFEILTVCNDRVVNSFLDITLEGKSIRYLRIKFQEEPIAIAKINIYS
ncbi:MAG: glycoside hydrolase family 2 TIM barrel-domain containing protein [Anaerocolumna sp.]